MTSKSTPILSSVYMCHKVTRLFTDDVLVSKLISFNPIFCSAISKLHFVRVEFSKNKFDTY